MQVLVPSTGNLYIYILTSTFDVYCSCSRPLHGESIYLRCNITTHVQRSVLVPSTGNLYIYRQTQPSIQCAQISSRPLHGNLYIYGETIVTYKDFNYVLVPSTGNLYIYFFQLIVKNGIKVLVPSTGNLYIYR